MDTNTSGAVFVQTNDAASNQVVAFRRGEDGALAQLGTYDTGGRGNGMPHLPSQGSIVAAGDHVLVTNPGSDDVSVFAIDRKSTRLNSSHIQKSRMPSSA